MRESEIDRAIDVTAKQKKGVKKCRALQFVT